MTSIAINKCAQISYNFVHKYSTILCTNILQCSQISYNFVHKYFTIVCTNVHNYPARWFVPNWVSITSVWNVHSRLCNVMMIASIMQCDRKRHNLKVSSLRFNIPMRTTLWNRMFVKCTHQKMVFCMNWRYSCSIYQTLR